MFTKPRFSQEIGKLRSLNLISVAATPMSSASHHQLIPACSRTSTLCLWKNTGQGFGPMELVASRSRFSHGVIGSRLWTASLHLKGTSNIWPGPPGLKMLPGINKMRLRKSKAETRKRRVRTKRENYHAIFSTSLCNMQNIPGAMPTNST